MTMPDAHADDVPAGPRAAAWKTVDKAIEEGKPQRLVLTVGGMDFVDEPAKAAAEWLKRNPHFLSHPGGGSGARNTGGGRQAPNLDGLGIGDLLKAGLTDE
jgi:hypothetical protein